MSLFIWFRDNYWHIIADNMPVLLEGLWTTIWLVGAALCLGLLLAVPLGMLMASKKAGWWRLPAFAFSYVFRGTPMLVQLYIIYYGIGLQIGAIDGIRESALWPILRQPWPWTLLAFTLNTAAYTSEIVRGVIETVPKGEVEAATAMGMNDALLIRRIILPNAIVRALPAYSNEIICMLHGSAIASVVTIMDITGVARNLYAKYYEPFTPFITAAILYLIITSIIVIAFQLLEKRLSRHL